MRNDKTKQKYANNVVARAKNGLKVIGIISIVVIVVAVFGFVVKSLWNWLMPEIFNLGTITYWQGIGLIILSKIFFGGVSGSSNKSKVDVDEEIREATIIYKKKHNDFYNDYENNHAEGAEDNEFKEQVSVDNSDQEKIYEEWWIKEGEETFTKYIKKMSYNEGGSDMTPE